MSSFNCPFCDITMPITDDTHTTRYPSFQRENGRIFFNNGTSHIENDCIRLDFYKCPECENVTVIASNLGKYYKKPFCTLINPKSTAKHFPEYVPKVIRDDYEEAYSIVNLSPKASATLARRCLQGIIRDFHGITKSRLIDEINALQNMIPVAQWKAIDALRSIGNIGAHMEKDVNLIIDVDHDEAEKLLKLIELLIDKWYIARHDEENLLSEIINIADDKKSKKQSNHS